MSKEIKPIYKDKAVVSSFFAMVASVIVTFSSVVWVPDYAANLQKDYYTLKYTCYGKCKPTSEPSEQVKLLINYDEMQKENEARPYKRVTIQM